MIALSADDIADLRRSAISGAMIVVAHGKMLGKDLLSLGSEFDPR
jgi:hypothetical protein